MNSRFLVLIPALLMILPTLGQGLEISLRPRIGEILVSIEGGDPVWSLFQGSPELSLGFKVSDKVSIEPSISGGNAFLPRSTEELVFYSDGPTLDIELGVPIHLKSFEKGLYVRPSMGTILMKYGSFYGDSDWDVYLKPRVGIGGKVPVIDRLSVRAEYGLGFWIYAGSGVDPIFVTDLSLGLSVFLGKQSD